MKNTMEKLNKETIRYALFGVLTVLVNIFLFFFFSTFFSPILANSLAFLLSVCFAYWTNSQFVFQTSCSLQTFLPFFSLRLSTIFIDNGGMWLLLKYEVHELLAKCLVNAVIIVINYLLSKWIIFKEKGVP